MCSPQQLFTFTITFVKQPSAKLNFSGIKSTVVRAPALARLAIVLVYELRTGAYFRSMWPHFSNAAPNEENRDLATSLL